MGKQPGQDSMDEKESDSENEAARENHHAEGDSLFFSSLFLSEVHAEEEIETQTVGASRGYRSRSVSRDETTVSGDETSRNGSKRKSANGMERASSANSTTETKKRRSKPKQFQKITKGAMKKKKESRSLPTKTQFGPSKASPSFSFSSFVGHCFSFTQIPQRPNSTRELENEETDDAETDENQDILSDVSADGSAPTKSAKGKMGSRLRRMSPGRGRTNTKMGGTKGEVQLQKRLASYVSALEKMKQRNRALELRERKMKKTLAKTSEEAMALKFENKLLKKGYVEKLDKADYGVEADAERVASGKWRTWTYQDMVLWVEGLNDGQFKKYATTLRVNLKMRKMRGVHLATLEKNDLTHCCGIVEWDDVCDLYREIARLTGKPTSGFEE